MNGSLMMNKNTQNPPYFPTTSQTRSTSRLQCSQLLNLPSYLLAYTHNRKKGLDTGSTSMLSYTQTDAEKHIKGGTKNENLRYRT